MALSLYYKAQGSTGSDILKYPGTVPMQFRGELTHTVSANADGSNHNVRIKAVMPVTRLVDGRVVSSDAFIASFSFTALQGVDEPLLRAETVDELIAHLTKHKADILNGVLPGLNDYSVV